MRHGYTLAELVITLAIAGVLLTLLLISAGRVSATSAQLSERNRSLLDTDSLFNQIRAELENASWIDSTSHSKKLLFTTITTTGVPANKGYRIRNVNGSEILEMSADGGASWSTPFLNGVNNNYTITGAKFLYCGLNRNCTDFTDTNGNGDYQAGVDAAPVRFTDVDNIYGGAALSNPSHANRIAWQDFRFTKTVGNKLMTITWGYTWFEPGVFFRQVAPTTTLLQSFSTNAVGSRFNTGFDVQGLCWESTQNRLVLAGYAAGRDPVYTVNREGVAIGPVKTMSLSTVGIQRLDGIAVKEDGNTALVLDTGANWYGVMQLSTGRILSQRNLSGVMSSSLAIAYNPADFPNMFILGVVGGNFQVVSVNISTGLSSASWNLPAGLTAPDGLAVDPISGDFYLLNNVVTGTGNSRTLTVYRVQRASPTVADTFAINLASIGSNATNATTNHWGIAIDSTLNRLFLSDTFSDRVYELSPPRLLYPLI